MDSDRVEIPGSELTPVNGERILPAAADQQTLTVTILLRRNPHQSGPSEEDLFSGRYQASAQSAAAARAAVSADPGDMAAVRSFAERYGLKVVHEDLASRSVRVRGMAAAMEKAFGVQLTQTENASGQRFLTYRGAISVPRAIGDIVTAVLGLDERPVAAPRTSK